MRGGTARERDGGARGGLRSGTAQERGRRAKGGLRSGTAQERGRIIELAEIKIRCIMPAAKLFFFI